MVFDEANSGNVIFIFGKNKASNKTQQYVFNKNQELIEYKNKIDLIYLISTIFTPFKHII